MPATAKILIAGGFGVGKTTLVGAISEIRPLRTEEVLSDRGIGIDDTSGADRKATTTVALDFGRITFRADLTLYLFGTPGQERFWFIWDELAYGAVGAVVLADTRRLADCFAAVDYFEHRVTPFLVAVNCFDGAPSYQPEDVRIALDLDPDTPVVLCDARQHDSVKKCSSPWSCTPSPRAARARSIRAGHCPRTEAACSRPRPGPCCVPAGN